MTTVFINIKELIQIENSPKRVVSGKEMKILPIVKNAFLLIENDVIKDFGNMDKFAAYRFSRDDRQILPKVEINGL